MKLSAVLIVLNEEKKISGCVEALKFCDEVVVMDGGSKDQTREIAQRLGARVFERSFDDFAAQKNAAIAKAQGEWILQIDADEIVEKALSVEINSVLEKPAADAYWIRRENRLFGRAMRYGANAGDWQLRLIRRGLAEFKGIVHERMIPPAKTARLKHTLFHDSTESVSVYMGKLNHYTAREATLTKVSVGSPAKLGRQSAAVWLRDFVLKRGFLDGLEGFLFAVLSAYYFFIKRAKAWEIKNALKGPA